MVEKCKLVKETITGYSVRQYPEDPLDCQEPDMFRSNTKEEAERMLELFKVQGKGKRGMFIVENTRPQFEWYDED